ncbi:uncharacterized protein TNCV_2301311 [Trichonephila clavipes]|nr:uncharacterized protein TNCV_2301311 [Trichonephila clavipes]
MSSLAFFAHANVFHHGGQPVPVELSIASIPEDGTEPKVICITVDHSNLLTTDKDRRANRYINERLSLKSHLPGSVPLEYLDFCVRGKFCQLAQGNRSLIVVKGSDQRKIFEKLGLFTINLEILPHFQDLNDHSLPDHLHDEVHENFDISECTMVKSYRFARYLQYFNKLQAECKKQTAHLVEIASGLERRATNPTLMEEVAITIAAASADFPSATVRQQLKPIDHFIRLDSTLHSLTKMIVDELILWRSETHFHLDGRSEGMGHLGPGLVSFSTLS